MKVTIEKVAEIAGVSRGAVDKVIHDRPGVKQSVREHVLQVIEQTGYVPLHAKVKSGQCTNKTIAIILPQLHNSFYQALKRGIDDANIQQGEPIKLEYYHYYNEVDTVGILSILDFLEEHDIDACIIRGFRSHLLCERLNRLSEKDIAVIFIDSDVPETTRLCYVSEDCYRSGRIATSLLAKSIGFHGKVALISSSSAVTNQRLRTRGFEDAIRERWPEMSLIEHVYTQEQSVIAYERTCALLDQHPNLCGIFSIAGCAGEIGQAVIDRKRADKVKMICYNLTQSVIALIKKGLFNFPSAFRHIDRGLQCIRWFTITW